MWWVYVIIVVVSLLSYRLTENEENKTNYNYLFIVAGIVACIVVYFLSSHTFHEPMMSGNYFDN